MVKIATSMQAGVRSRVPRGQQSLRQQKAELGRKRSAPGGFGSALGFGQVLVD